MDLRSILSDDSKSASASAPSARSSQQLSPIQHQQQHPQTDYHPIYRDSKSYPPAQHAPRLDTRLSNHHSPHPQSLPHHGTSPTAAYPQHQSLPSPYNATPSSSTGGSQYPFPPPDVPQRTVPSQPDTPGYPQRNTIAGPPVAQSYAQPSPAPLTPSGSGPTNPHPYPPYLQSQYAHHPNAQNPALPTFSRENSQLIHTHPSLQRQATTGGASHSLPGTPLGPPPIIGRPSPILHRESSGPYGYDHQRTQSGSSYGHSPMSAQSPSTLTEGSGANPLLGSPRSSQIRHPQPQARSHLGGENRDRSVSVSPKTRLPSGPPPPVNIDGRIPNPLNPANYQQSIAEPLRQGYHSNRSSQDRALPWMADHVQDQSYDRPPSALTPMKKDLQQANSMPSPHKANTSSPTLTYSSGPLQLTRDLDGHQHQPSHTVPSPHSSSVTPARQMPSTPQPRSNNQTPTSHVSATPPRSTSSSGPPIVPPTPTVATGPPTLKHEMSDSPGPMNSSSGATKRKRQRLDEPPIWARKANKASPLLPPRRQPSGKPPLAKQDSNRSNSSIIPIPSLPQKVATNGHPLPVKDAFSTPALPPVVEETHPGNWEPSIINVTPFEEVHRMISDFLFREVVMRDDVGSGAPGSGAALEIEAKLGQLIDNDTGFRLNIPAMTETIINTSALNTSRTKIAFRSSMSEMQHRNFNSFLNESLKESLGMSTRPPGPSGATSSTPGSRIPMSYVHTRERDVFHELPSHLEHQLPASIRQSLRHRAKVRVTTDQKTGAELAKIVKARVADIDVYSPRTPFDWRISVNLEMKWGGDVADLGPGASAADGVNGGGGGMKGRDKDRMTYRHLSYQIDLTQVKSMDGSLTQQNAEKEHELEIEVAADEVRKQGLALQQGRTNNFQELVKGFVDNCRVLSRNCQ
ncbi:mRNA-capping enzyme subunit beta [Agyrium rufum]|nr:mRNA-capping enzyme subunit beta [Agyrium rufum]